LKTGVRGSGGVSDGCRRVAGWMAVSRVARGRWQTTLFLSRASSTRFLVSLSGNVLASRASSFYFCHAAQAHFARRAFGRCRRLQEGRERGMAAMGGREAVGQNVGRRGLEGVQEVLGEGLGREVSCAPSLVGSRIIFGRSICLRLFRWRQQKARQSCRGQAWSRGQRLCDGARFRTGGKRGLGQGFVSAGEDSGKACPGD